MALQEMNEYRRELALVSLRIQGKEMTSSDLAELMVTLAKDEGHPAACWSGISAQHVAGHLRMLEAAGEVAKGVPVPNGRAGTTTPTWRATYLATESTRLLPDPPEGVVAVRAPLDGISVEGMTVPQLRTVLRLNDETCAIVGRFMRDMRDLGERAREELQRVGL